MITAKEERVLALVERRARGASYPISELIADNGTQNTRNEKPAKRNHILACKNPRGHQKRIAGQEETNKKTGLDEKNCADEPAEKIGANPLNELFQTFGAVK